MAKSPVVDAIRANDLDALKTALPPSEDVNKIVESAWTRTTPFNLALEHGDLSMVKWLIEQGAYPDVPSEYPIDNAIDVAVRSGSPGKLKLVLSLSQPLAAYQNGLTDKGARLWNRALLAYPMVGALIANGFDLKLLDESLMMITVRHFGDKQQKAFGQVLGLIEKHGGNVRDPLGMLVAITEGKFALLALLQQHGARLDALQEEHPKVLHNLAPHCHAPHDVIAQALDVSDVNAIDRFGDTALALAAEQGNARLIKAILHHADGASLEACDRSGRTPLARALLSHQAQSAHALLDAGADPNISVQEGYSALDYCLSSDDLADIVDLLRLNGAKTQIELEGLTLSTAARQLAEHIDPGEPWAHQALQDINQQPDEIQNAWLALLAHCSATKATKPSKAWLKKADKLVTPVGQSNLETLVIGWLARLKEKRTTAPLTPEGSVWEWGGDSAMMVSPNSVAVLKGLLWLLGLSDSQEAATALRQAAECMYKKVRGIGMRNAKVANAALVALENMSGDLGAKEIAILHTQTKYNPALTHINRVFERIAKERGMTTEELAATAVSDYGLNRDSQFLQTLGDFTACVSLLGAGKTSFTWQKSDGKEQKSVPAAVKSEYPDEIKALKALVKDLQKASSAQSQRIESDYLRAVVHEASDTWFARYIEHPVTGVAGRNLVWRFDGEEPVDGVWCDGDFVGPDGKLIDWRNRVVRLWHPIMSEPNVIHSWRRYFIDHELVQPFKQVFREVYILTDAEIESGDQSARFAGHVIRQSQFNALATGRFWRQMRGGHWDGGGETEAYRDLSAHNISVIYNTTPIEALGESGYGIYEYLSTGSVQFFRSRGRIALTDVEPLVFSEVMRDVDLFVAVCSVANDPDWEHRETVSYWSDHGFGDLSQSAATRREVLEALAPKLKIASQLEITDRFLEVKGKLTTYKIHFGSGNILMSPGDQYLCIIPKGVRAKSLYLPFEGDSTLALILSKAFMLADDDKIKDRSITSQISQSQAA
ncbi:MAG: DUF4132 domain-containing protein [Pseudomonadota bacterium]